MNPFNPDGVVRCPETTSTHGDAPPHAADDVEEAADDWTVSNIDDGGDGGDTVHLAVVGGVFKGVENKGCIVFTPCDYRAKGDVRCKVVQRIGGRKGLRGRLQKVAVDRNDAPGVHIGVGAIRFGVLLATLRRGGVRVVEEVTGGWDVLWAKRVKIEEHRGKKVNHFPGTWGVGRKDSLARNLKKSGFESIHPKTFTLPAEQTQFAKTVETHPEKCYIVKPAAAAGGMGITLIKGPPTPPSGAAQLVAQEYIENPLLIEGVKFDLRLYVAVTCYNPLRIYLYQEGIVRLATEKYPGGFDVNNHFAHLTNYTINKENSSYTQGGCAEDDDEVGHKWLLSVFKEYCGEKGYPWEEIWKQIGDIIAKTFFCIEEDVTEKIAVQAKGNTSCFEIFGVDIILDEGFKASLLEVNIMPSINTVSPLDEKVKCNFLADLLTMIGVVKQKKKTAPSFSRPRPVKELPLPSPPPPLPDYLDSLPPTHRAVIIDSENEYQRSTGFHRVYPTLERGDTFGKKLRGGVLNRLLVNWEKVKLAEHARRGLDVPEEFL